MDLQKFIRVVQSGAVLLIFLGAAIGFGTEIFFGLILGGARAKRRPNTKEIEQTQKGWDNTKKLL